MGYVLLKDRKLALLLRQGPEINSLACLWVLLRPHHHTNYWLTNQCLIHEEGIDGDSATLSCTTHLTLSTYSN